jgi:hypothetical protein
LDNLRESPQQMRLTWLGHGLLDIAAWSSDRTADQRATRQAAKHHLLTIFASLDQGRNFRVNPIVREQQPVTLTIADFFRNSA